MADVNEVVQVWKEYTDSLEDWQSLIEGVEPKDTICGPVYEPVSPMPGRTETLAIGDMRNTKVAHPHYHSNGETEIYFVLQGKGLTVVGGEEKQLKKGVVIVTPPNTAHFTIPEKDLVIVIINMPSFNPANNIEISETDPAVKFNKEQYESLLGTYE